MLETPSVVQAPTILIVDDDQDTVWALKELLKASGYAIHTAASGEEALVEYAARQPDLVLMDVGLPGMDGIETCHELHRRHGDGCAPIMLMSGSLDLTPNDSAFPAGAVDFLVKPFQSRDALVHIRAHLEGRRYAMRQQVLAAELSRVSAAKDKLLCMCAHDLRNPLSSVRGLAEFLLEPSIGPLNAEQIKLVQAIREASQAMLDLVNELLDVSVIEAGQLRLNRVSVSLREIARSAVCLASIAAGQKGTRIVLHPETAPEPPLLLDPTRIREVVDNLLSNAIKYSPSCSVVEVTVESIPTQDKKDVCMRLSVRDQGPGIPAGERDRLFRDFGRLSTRPTNGEKSIGLGLAICRKVMDAHGGRIDAVNQPEGGCVFSITLSSSSCEAESCTQVAGAGGVSADQNAGLPMAEAAVAGACANPAGAA